MKVLINAEFIDLNALRNSEKGFKTPVLSVVDLDQWYVAWVSCDRSTGEPRMAKNGKAVICNLRKQRRMAELQAG